MKDPRMQCVFSRTQVISNSQERHNGHGAHQSCYFYWNSRIKRYSFFSVRIQFIHSLRLDPCGYFENLIYYLFSFLRSCPRPVSDFRATHTFFDDIVQFFFEWSECTSTVYVKVMKNPNSTVIESEASFNTWIFSIKYPEDISTFKNNATK